jgi:autotransporter translocation and assembly factor TamB
LKGELTSRYGRLNYLGTDFVIEEVTAGFLPHQGFRPEISLSASSWIGEYIIAMMMSGSYPDLHIRLASEPPLSQQEIMAMLRWPGHENKAEGELGSGGAIFGILLDILQGSVQRELVGEMENTLRDELGLDMLHLEPDLFQRSLRIMAGKYVLPKVYLTYERSLFSEPREELRLEYRFGSGWKLSGGLSKDSGFSLKMEMKTRF